MEFKLVIFIGGYILQHIGSYILIKKIHDKKSLQGISLESQVMYFIGTIMRLLYIFDTRLSETFLIWIDLAAAVGLETYILYLFY
jgi:ER lumen protein retaining receptor